MKIVESDLEIFKGNFIAYLIEVGDKLDFKSPEKREGLLTFLVLYGKNFYPSIFIYKNVIIHIGDDKVYITAAYNPEEPIPKEILNFLK